MVGELEPALEGARGDAAVQEVALVLGLGLAAGDDQLALAIGKEGLNARLAARLTGWKVDIQSDTEFAQAEAEAAFAGAGADDDDYSGRCAAILSNGKRCPNASLPGSKYCGVPAHQALADVKPGGAGSVDVEAELTQAEIRQEEAAVAVAEAEPPAEELSAGAETMVDGAAEALVVEELETEVVGEAEGIAAKAVAETGLEEDGEPAAAEDGSSQA